MGLLIFNANALHVHRQTNVLKKSDESHLGLNRGSIVKATDPQKEIKHAVNPLGLLACYFSTI